jgi:hypothetical protein
LGLHLHGPNRPSVGIRAEDNTALHPSGGKSTNRAPGKLFSRSTSKCVLSYTSALNRIFGTKFLPLGILRPLLIATFEVGRLEMMTMDLDLDWTLVTLNDAPDYKINVTDLVALRASRPSTRTR